MSGVGAGNYVGGNAAAAGGAAGAGGGGAGAAAEYAPRLPAAQLATINTVAVDCTGRRAALAGKAGVYVVDLADAFRPPPPVRSPAPGAAAAAMTMMSQHEPRRRLQMAHDDDEQQQQQQQPPAPEPAPEAAPLLLPDSSSRHPAAVCVDWCPHRPAAHLLTATTAAGVLVWSLSEAGRPVIYASLLSSPPAAASSSSSSSPAAAAVVVGSGAGAQTLSSSSSTALAGTVASSSPSSLLSSVSVAVAGVGGGAAPAAAVSALLLLPQRPGARPTAAGGGGRSTATAAATGGTGAVRQQVAWSRGDVNVLATCAADSLCSVWDIRDPQRPLKLKSFCGWTTGATHVAWHRQTAHWLASVHQGEVRVWDVRRVAAPLACLTCHMAPILGIDWSHTEPDEFLTYSADRTVKLWHVPLQGPVAGSGGVSQQSQMHHHQQHARSCKATLSPGATPLKHVLYTPFGMGLVTASERQRQPPQQAQQQQQRQPEQDGEAFFAAAAAAGSGATVKLWATSALSVPLKQYVLAPPDVEPVAVAWRCTAAPAAPSAASPSSSSGGGAGNSCWQVLAWGSDRRLHSLPVEPRFQLGLSGGGGGSVNRGSGGISPAAAPAAVGAAGGDGQQQQTVAGSLLVAAAGGGNGAAPGGPPASVAFADETGGSPLRLRSLQQEFALLERKKPRTVVVELISVAQRLFVASLAGRPGLHLRVSFPDSYPDRVPPSFQLEAGASSSGLPAAAAARVVDKLRETAAYHVEQNRPCLYQVLCQFVLALKDTTTSSGGPDAAGGAPTAEQGQHQQQGGGGSSSSGGRGGGGGGSTSGGVSAALKALRATSSMHQQQLAAANDEQQLMHLLPAPRTSAAVFNSIGKLVSFRSAPWGLWSTTTNSSDAAAAAVGGAGAVMTTPAAAAPAGPPGAALPVPRTYAELKAAQQQHRGPRFFRGPDDLSSPRAFLMASALALSDPNSAAVGGGGAEANNNPPLSANSTIGSSSEQQQQQHHQQQFVLQSLLPPDLSASTAAAGGLQHCVQIRDLSHLMPLDRELAVAYRVRGGTPESMCAANAAAAARSRRGDLDQLWRTVALLMERSVYNAAAAAAAGNGGSSRWRTHLLPQRYLRAMFEQYLRLGDVQTLAVLSCVLDTRPHPADPHLCSHSTMGPMGAHDAAQRLTPPAAAANVGAAGGMSAAGAPAAAASAASWRLLQAVAASRGLSAADWAACCDRWRLLYGDVLYCWQLPQQRAEVVKFLSSVPLLRGRDNPLVFGVNCVECEKPIDTGQQLHCPTCKAFAFLCSICHLPVRGLSNFCVACGHGGHTAHMAAWFRLHSECPTGCKCICMLHDPSIIRVHLS